MERKKSDRDVPGASEAAAGVPHRFKVSRMARYVNASGVKCNGACCAWTCACACDFRYMHGHALAHAEHRWNTLIGRVPRSTGARMPEHQTGRRHRRWVSVPALHRYVKISVVKCDSACSLQIGIDVGKECLALMYRYFKNDSAYAHMESQSTMQHNMKFHECDINEAGGCHYHYHYRPSSVVCGLWSVVCRPSSVVCGPWSVVRSPSS